MNARLALTLALAFAAPASAMTVRVPSVPAKFAVGSHAASWRAWELPLIGAYADARGGKVALSPQLEAFAPVTGAAKKDGEAAPFMTRSAALHLLTAQFTEMGLKPAEFAALPAAERVSRMQAAYDVLRGELRAAGESIAKSAEEAAKAGDAAALHEAQARLSLLTAAHTDYMDSEVRQKLRAARDAAFAAHAKLTGAAVDGAAKSGAQALAGGAGGGPQGFAALGDAPDPWRGASPDPHAAARKHLLAPLSGGKVPADFIEAFARYQRMGDPGLSFDALAVFKPILATPFVTGPDAARALAGVGLVAREAPAQRARDLAVQVLIKNRFLAPELESLRVFTLRDVGVAATDKELAARVLKSLAADAGAKREGPAGEALAAVEAAWRKNFAVPTPVESSAARASSEKWLKKGGMGLLTGLLPVLMAAVGWFPTAMPEWLPFLGFLNPFMPYLPYVGLVFAVAYLGVGLYFKLRAGPKR